MSQLDELAEAVRENPDDVTRWLVYADALAAAGDPRGELIVLAHRRKERRLRLRIERYLSRFDGGALLETLRRGLVEVELHMGHWRTIANGPHDFEPWQILRDQRAPWRPSAQAMREMLAAPLGQFVQSVTASFVRSADIELVAAASGAHRALRTLDLRCEEEWDASRSWGGKQLQMARAINALTLGNVVHPGLRTLEITLSASAELASALGAWRCPRLTAVTVSGAWTEPLRRSQVDLPALEVLSVDPSPNVVDLIAEAPFAGQLIALRFNSAPSERTARRLLERRPAFPRMRRVDSQRWEDAPPGVRTLIASAFSPRAI